MDLLLLESMPDKWEVINAKKAIFNGKLLPKEAY
tara:strand:- start:3754 stop:3855 length:102 start_codon:yes stop_codon:yes gene_type:complete